MKLPNFVQRAQRNFRLPSFKRGRLGVTGAFSLVALAAIFVAGMLLDLRSDRAEVARFAAFARESKQDPVPAIVDGARSHRFVFLADVRGAREPKRLAAQAIEAIAQGPGLDAVVVEVGSEQQPYLDIYFNAEPEDASVLLSHPRTVPETGQVNRDYLELYHQIWKLNEKLGADRRIRVIAGDLKGWPDGDGVSPAERARRFGERGPSMVKTLDQEVLSLTSRARVLVFMSGLQALRSGYGELQTGGTATVTSYWFGSAMADRNAGEVFTVIVDAGAGAGAREFIDYRGTRIEEVAEGALPGGSYALKVGPEFDFLSNPLAEHTAPGLSFDIVPRNYKLKDVADLYVHLGR